MRAKKSTALAKTTKVTKITEKTIHKELAKWPKVPIDLSFTEVIRLLDLGIFELVLTEKGKKVLESYIGTAVR